MIRSGGVEETPLRCAAALSSRPACLPPHSRPLPSCPSCASAVITAGPAGAAPGARGSLSIVTPRCLRHRATMRAAGNTTFAASASITTSPSVGQKPRAIVGCWSVSIHVLAAARQTPALAAMDIRCPGRSLLWACSPSIAGAAERRAKTAQLTPRKICSLSTSCPIRCDSTLPLTVAAASLRGRRPTCSCLPSCGSPASARRSSSGARR